MSRATDLVAAAFERREPTDGSSIRAWRRQVATRLDCASNAVIAWCEGVSAPSLDSLRALAADPEFGPEFLTEIFSDLGIVCMSAEDAAMGQHGITDKTAALRAAAMDIVQLIDASPAKPTSASTLRNVDVGGREGGER